MGKLLKKKDTKFKKKKSPGSELSASGKTGAASLPKPSGIISKAGADKGKLGLFGKKGGSAAARGAKAKVQPNVIDKSVQFLREVKVELKKVTWPSRKQTLGSTVVVLVLVMIISFFLGIVDIGLSSLVQVVLQ